MVKQTQTFEGLVMSRQNYRESRYAGQNFDGSVR